MFDDAKGVHSRQNARKCWDLAAQLRLRFPAATFCSVAGSPVCLAANYGFGSGSWLSLLWRGSYRCFVRGSSFCSAAVRLCARARLREIASQAAACGKRVCFASLEMPAVDMVKRVASQMTLQMGHGISFSDFESGRLDDRQYQAVIDAARRVSELPIDFLPEHYRDIGALYAGARQSAARISGLDLFVVAYLQLLRLTQRGR